MVGITNRDIKQSREMHLQVQAHVISGNLKLGKLNSIYSEITES